MSLTINPCPFCGHGDVVIDELAPGIAAICCDECKAIGPHTDGTHTVEQAIAKWNTAGDTLRQVQRHDSIVTEQCIALERRIEQMRTESR